MSCNLSSSSFHRPALPSMSHLLRSSFRRIGYHGRSRFRQQGQPHRGAATRASPLEPLFEHLLHDAKVDVSTIWALRHCQIADRETFAALHDSVEGLQTFALDMGIDLADGGMPHRREFARITTAWKKARAQAEIKVSTEALQKQHGEPVAMLPEDWTSVIVQFKTKYGPELQDDELPSQFYYEEFQERLSAGMLRAETLDQVISMAEQEEHERLKPDPPKQFGIHFDSKLTLQTRRRFTVSAPRNTEELRAKYEVMSNMWPLAQLRQPGRSLFSDLLPTTFSRILKQLLGKEDFGIKKKFLSAPTWAHCLSYEYELRREAYKQCRESTVGFSEAWWNAYRSQQHRMMYWLQLVSLANSAPSSSFSSAVQSQQVAKLQKELADLRNEVRNRSRTPAFRGRGRGGVSVSVLFRTGSRFWHSQRRRGRRHPPHPKARAKGKAREPGVKPRTRTRSGAIRMSRDTRTSASIFCPAKRTTRYASITKSTSVTLRTVPGHTAASAAEVPSRTTSATACKAEFVRFPEQQQQQSLKLHWSQMCLPGALRSFRPAAQCADFCWWRPTVVTSLTSWQHFGQPHRSALSCISN